MQVVTGGTAEPTQDAALQKQKGKGVRGVQLLYEKANREYVTFGWSSVKHNQQTPLSA